MTITSIQLNEKALELRLKRDELKSRLHSTRQEIIEIDAQLRLIKQLEGESPGGESEPNDGPTVAKTFKRRPPVVAVKKAAHPKVSPTMAILSLLKENPSGLSQSELIDQAEPRIITTSDKPRRILQNLILQLKQKGRISKNEDGVLKYVKRKPTGFGLDG